MTTLAILFPLLCVAPASPSDGAAAQGRALAQRVQRHYAATRDFSAHFVQQRVSGALGRKDDSSGLVRVKKPGLVRWDYEKPEPRSIYLEGHTLWLVFPEEHQAQVNRRFGGDQLSSAFTFLWGKGDLLREFVARRVELPDGLPQGEALALTPKKPLAGIQELLFVVGKEGAVLATVTTSPQGDTNRIVFTGTRTDQGLAADVFQYQPPKGVFVQEL